MHDFLNKTLNNAGVVLSTPWTQKDPTLEASVWIAFGVVDHLPCIVVYSSRACTITVYNYAWDMEL